MIDGSRVDEAIFPAMLRNLACFIFQKDNLPSILKINRRIALDIIFSLFKPPAREIMKEVIDLRVDVDSAELEKLKLFDR